MISYEPFFKTLKEKNISTYTLFVKMGFSSATYYRMRDNHVTKSDTIDLLCKLLDCEVSDIMEYLPDND